MANQSIRIEGLDKLIRKLDNLGKGKEVKAAIRSAADTVRKDMMTYPPTSRRRHNPGPYPARWYQRGYGPRYARKDGSLGGYETSKDLRGSWELKSINNGYGQIVGTNVHYAPYVQSDEKQASYMKDIGWKTDKDIVEKRRDYVVKLIKGAIDKILNRE